MTNTKHIRNAIKGLPDDEFLRTPHPANRQHIYSNHLKALVAENERYRGTLEQIRDSDETDAIRLQNKAGVALGKADGGNDD